jgi:broad specificity phosphatase PhoE
MTRIYLIRHAESAGNFGRIFQGQADTGLSENGLAQLERLKERCRSLHFDAVYSSPLKRAYMTAQAANFYHNLPITTLDGLMEINGGCWEGQLWDDFPVTYPEENRCWIYEPWNFKTQGGETMREVYERIWATVCFIAGENPGRSVCVVSHGCAIRNFLCRVSGLTLRDLNQVKWCDNTAVSIIDFDEALTPNIVLLNDASHLDEETTTLGKQLWWKDFEPENLSEYETRRQPQEEPERGGQEGGKPCG